MAAVGLGLFDHYFVEATPNVICLVLSVGPGQNWSNALLVGSGLYQGSHKGLFCSRGRHLSPSSGQNK